MNNMSKWVLSFNSEEVGNEEGGQQLQICVDTGVGYNIKVVCFSENPEHLNFDIFGKDQEYLGGRSFSYESDVHVLEYFTRGLLDELNPLLEEDNKFTVDSIGEIPLWALNRCYGLRKESDKVNGDCIILFC